MFKSLNCLKVSDELGAMVQAFNPSTWGDDIVLKVQTRGPDFNSIEAMLT